MKINRFLKKKLEREFPFLKEFNLENGVELKIQKARTEWLFKLTPNSYRHVGSLGETNEGLSVSFVLADGSLLRDSVKEDWTEKSNYAHEGERNGYGETVAEAISRLDIDPIFVIIEQFKSSHWSGMDAVDDRSITVYKAVDSKSILSAANKAADRMLKEEMTNLL
jgi:hypothetical protein